MNGLLESSAAQLRHYTRAEIVALLRDFLAGLDEQQQIRFLNLVAQGPRPLVAEAMGLDDAKDLLDAIEALHDAIANDDYVEYGAGYDPEYKEYRGFGDDSWIDEMDDLFTAATSFFRAGQFEAAADAYLALFHIFDLGQDGFHFTRPDPVVALRTDVDKMKENLFIAIGRCATLPGSFVSSGSTWSRWPEGLTHVLRAQGLRTRSWSPIDCWTARCSFTNGWSSGLSAAEIATTMRKPERFAGSSRP
jgi:hypothetical protein